MRNGDEPVAVFRRDIKERNSFPFVRYTSGIERVSTLTVTRMPQGRPLTKSLKAEPMGGRRKAEKSDSAAKSPSWPL